jgi:hypothetical protein
MSLEPSLSCLGAVVVMEKRRVSMRSHEEGIAMEKSHREYHTRKLATRSTRTRERERFLLLRIRTRRVISLAWCVRNEDKLYGYGMRIALKTLVIRSRTRESWSGILTPRIFRHLRPRARRRFSILALWSRSSGARERARDFRFWLDLFGLDCLNHSIPKIYVLMSVV